MEYKFSENSLKYLKNIRKNNSREWYLNNKSDYHLYLVKPFQYIVGELSSVLLKIDPEIETTPAIDKTISRIYRDTRFSSDKSLYRDSMWLTFMKKTKEKADYPAFFFEITPLSYRYGMGFFSASVKTMNSCRDLIMNKENIFLKIIFKINAEKTFIPEGELYKRDRYTGRTKEITKWYNRKNIYLVNNQSNIKNIFDMEKLTKQLKDGFIGLSEMYKFFKEAVNNKNKSNGHFA
jgi:uncharacterized protein (TIGR02453 family)